MQRHLAAPARFLSSAQPGHGPTGPAQGGLCISAADYGRFLCLALGPGPLLEEGAFEALYSSHPSYPPALHRKHQQPSRGAPPRKMPFAERWRYGCGVWIERCGEGHEGSSSSAAADGAGAVGGCLPEQVGALGFMGFYPRGNPRTGTFAVREG